MRTKTLLLCLLSLFVISSCSSDDDNNGFVGPEVKKQIKRMSSTQLLDSGEYETTVIDFVYENDKVIRWDTNEDVVYHFSYEGDKLKMVTTTDGEKITAYYEGDRLLYTITNDGIVESRENYGYNAKEQLIYKTCEVGYSCREPYPITYAYAGNNMTTTTLVMDEEVYKEILSYDNGINPFKFYSTNFRIMMSEMIYLTLSDNNPRQQDLYLNNSSQLEGRIIYENTYDKDNYPITVIGKRSNDRQTIMSHRFEYF